MSDNVRRIIQERDINKFAEALDLPLRNFNQKLLKAGSPFNNYVIQPKRLSECSTDIAVKFQTSSIAEAAERGTGQSGEAPKRSSFEIFQEKTSLCLEDCKKWDEANTLWPWCHFLFDVSNGDVTGLETIEMKNPRHDPNHQECNCAVSRAVPEKFPVLDKTPVPETAPVLEEAPILKKTPVLEEPPVPEPLSAPMRLAINLSTPSNLPTEPPIDEPVKADEEVLKKRKIKPLKMRKRPVAATSTPQVEPPALGFEQPQQDSTSSTQPFKFSLTPELQSLIENKSAGKEHQDPASSVSHTSDPLNPGNHGSNSAENKPEDTDSAKEWDTDDDFELALLSGFAECRNSGSASRAGNANNDSESCNSEKNYNEIIVPSDIDSDPEFEGYDGEGNSEAEFSDLDFRPQDVDSGSEPLDIPKSAYGKKAATDSGSDAHDVATNFNTNNLNSAGLAVNDTEVEMGDALPEEPKFQQNSLVDLTDPNNAQVEDWKRNELLSAHHTDTRSPKGPQIDDEVMVDSEGQSSGSQLPQPHEHMQICSIQRENDHMELDEAKDFANTAKTSVLLDGSSSMPLEASNHNNPFGFGLGEVNMDLDENHESSSAVGAAGPSSIDIDKQMDFSMTKNPFNIHEGEAMVLDENNSSSNAAFKIASSGNGVGNSIGGSTQKSLFSSGFSFGNSTSNSQVANIAAPLFGYNLQPNKPLSETASKPTFPGFSNWAKSNPFSFLPPTSDASPFSQIAVQPPPKPIASSTPLPFKSAKLPAFDMGTLQLPDLPAAKFNDKPTNSSIFRYTKNEKPTRRGELDRSSELVEKSEFTNVKSAQSDSAVSKTTTNSKVSVMETVTAPRQPPSRTQFEGSASVPLNPISKFGTDSVSSSEAVVKLTQDSSKPAHSNALPSATGSKDGLSVKEIIDTQVHTPLIALQSGDLCQKEDAIERPSVKEAHKTPGKASTNNAVSNVTRPKGDSTSVPSAEEVVKATIQAPFKSAGKVAVMDQQSTEPIEPTPAPLKLSGPLTIVNQELVEPVNASPKPESKVVLTSQQSTEPVKPPSAPLKLMDPVFIVDQEPVEPAQASPKPMCKIVLTSQQSTEPIEPAPAPLQLIQPVVIVNQEPVVPEPPLPKPECKIILTSEQSTEPIEPTPAPLQLTDPVVIASQKNIQPVEPPSQTSISEDLGNAIISLLQDLKVDNEQLRQQNKNLELQMSELKMQQEQQNTKRQRDTKAIFDGFNDYSKKLESIIAVLNAKAEKPEEKQSMPKSNPVSMVENIFHSVRIGEVVADDSLQYGLQTADIGVQTDEVKSTKKPAGIIEVTNSRTKVATKEPLFNMGKTPDLGADGLLVGMATIPEVLAQMNEGAMEQQSVGIKPTNTSFAVDNATNHDEPVTNSQPVGTREEIHSVDLIDNPTANRPRRTPGSITQTENLLISEPAIMQSESTPMGELNENNSQDHSGIAIKKAGLFDILMIIDKVIAWDEAQKIAYSMKSDDAHHYYPWALEKPIATELRRHGLPAGTAENLQVPLQTLIDLHLHLQLVVYGNPPNARVPQPLRDSLQFAVAEFNALFASSDWQDVSKVMKVTKKYDIMRTAFKVCKKTYYNFLSPEGRVGTASNDFGNLNCMVEQYQLNKKLANDCTKKSHHLQTTATLKKQNRSAIQYQEFQAKRHTQKCDQIRESLYVSGALRACDKIITGYIDDLSHVLWKVAIVDRSFQTQRALVKTIVDQLIDMYKHMRNILAIFDLKDVNPIEHLRL